MEKKSNNLVRESVGEVELKNLNYIEDTKAIDKTILKVQGNYTYSKILLVQGMVSMFACAYNMYSLGFLNSLPRFSCPDESGTFVRVPEADACARLD